MKNNVFIVRTPLQAFNAIEAKERFCQNQHNYIVIVYRNPMDKKLFETIILANEWSKIHYIKLKPHMKLLSFFRKLLKEMPRVEQCFLGDYSTIINYYMNRIKYQKLILLEDGSSTIRRAELLEKKHFHILKKTDYSPKNKLQIFLEKLLKIDVYYYYNGVFFTIYNLKNQIELISNDYRYFKNSISSLPKKEVAFFIGSEIKHRILVDVKTFEAYVSQVVQIYKQRDIDFYYILHRKEDELYMKELSERLNFKCLRFDTILELQFLKMNYIPCEVSTFLSTAVTTLHNLYPSTYKYYQLLEKDIQPKLQDSIQKIYIQFKKEGIDSL